MTDVVANIAKGRIVELHNRVKLGDPSAARFYLSTPTQPITIGSFGTPSGDFNFDGKLAHLAFYPSVLSSARLLAHAQAAGLA